MCQQRVLFPPTNPSNLWLPGIVFENVESAFFKNVEICTKYSTKYSTNAQYQKVEYLKYFQCEMDDSERDVDAKGCNISNFTEQA